MAKEKKEIAKSEESELTEVPEDLRQHAGTGTEGLGKEDLRPPRLMLAQSMSPQVKRGDPKYIEGLREAELFNSISQQVYGEGPLEFVVISYLGVRYVEFEDNKVVDGNVPPNDPRTQWTKDDDGNRVKPVADKFYDYVLFLSESQELVTFSLKGQAANTVGIDLNSLLKNPLRIAGQFVRNPPACARLLEMKTAMQKNDKGSWAVVQVRPKGLTPTDIRMLCYDLAKDFANKNVIIDREADSTEREPGEDID